MTAAPSPGPHGPTAAMAEAFEAARPRLMGLAYRMLGIVADAEDVVQEAWLRFQSSATHVDHPQAWLTTVTTRLAVDRLRASSRRREDYVGPWLPEPVVLAPGPEEVAELAESLTLGFLTVLDRLTPIERAVFLLADVFGVAYVDIASTVAKSEAACRQIASRARRRLAQSHALSGRPSGPDQQKVVDQLVLAVVTGDIRGALDALAPDVVLISDGGATRRAARRPVVGADRVARFLTNLATRYHDDVAVVAAQVNSDPGLVVSLGGRPDTVFVFEVDGGAVVAIWVIRNPDKLKHLDHAAAIS